MMRAAEKHCFLTTIEPLTVWVTAAVVVTRLGCPRLYELIQSGDLEVVKVRRATLILFGTMSAFKETTNILEQSTLKREATPENSSKSWRRPNPFPDSGGQHDRLSAAISQVGHVPSAFGSPAAQWKRTLQNAGLGVNRGSSPLFPNLLDLCPDQVRQRRIGIQAERLAWQIALKLDAPQVRQASHTDLFDQECQRHVGDR